MEGGEGREGTAVERGWGEAAVLADGREATVVTVVAEVMAEVMAVRGRSGNNTFLGSRAPIHHIETWVNRTAR